jgi:hypothetical protein
MNLITNIFIGWLFADLITGLVHWFEDKYLDESTEIGRDNVLHHTDPRAMTKLSYFENIQGSLQAGIPIIIFTAFFQWPLWFYLGFFFAMFGNLVHRWAHEPRPPAIVKYCQAIGLMTSNRKHMKHHAHAGKLITKAQAHSTYCAMSDWLNPVLNKIRFWKSLEWCLSRVGLNALRADL